MEVKVQVGSPPLLLPGFLATRKDRKSLNRKTILVHELQVPLQPALALTVLFT